MKDTAKTVGLVMIIIIFSRLMSLVSNLVYITYFGINLETDIYTYAIQLPNIIFTILGTAMVTVVIPIFGGYIGTGEKERAFKFAHNITSLSLITASGLALLGVFASPYILLLTRFKSAGYDFAVMALQIMFPVMVFYALNFALQGILQSMGRYYMPAFVSVPSSLAIIFYVFTLGDRFGVKGLIIATFIGLSLQGLILIPAVLRTDYRFKVSFDYRSEDIKKALKLVPPILIGTSAYQVNMLFNATLAANFKDAAALMITVQNLVLYAVLAFIYAITSVMFPKLTKFAATNDMEGFKNSLLKVLKVMAYFLIPCTAGFLAVGYQLIDFLYGWGKVTADNVSLAASIFTLYALAVFGIGIKEVVDRAFYSMKDTKKPAINGVVIMVVNIGVSLVLISFIGVLGIPLAYSISAITGAAVILYLVRKKIGAFGGKTLLISVLKNMAASIVMLGIIIPITILLKQFTLGQVFVDKALKLFIPAAAGGIIYFITTYLLKVEETIDIINRIRDRFFNKKGDGKTEKTLLKVLHLINYPGRGGTEKYILSLAEKLHNKKCVFYLGYSEDGHMLEQIRDMGIQAYKISMSSPYDLKAAWVVKSLCSKLSIDIVHTHFLRENYISVFSKLMLNRAVLVCTSHIFTQKSDLLSIFNGLFTLFVKKIIAVSHSIKEYISGQGVNHLKIEVIRNGVDINYWKGKRDLDSRRKIGVGVNDFVVTSVARFADEKDHFFLLETIKYFKKLTGFNYRKISKNVKFILVGDGELLEQSKKLAEMLGISEDVIFTGFIKDIGSILYSSDLFVSHSKREALGISILEAMACGLPVVATRAGGGPAEIINENTNCGILVENRDIEGFAAAILRFINDKAFYHMCRQNAYKTVKEKFNLDNTAKETYNLYIRCIKHKHEREKGDKMK